MYLDPGSGSILIQLFFCLPIIIVLVLVFLVIRALLKSQKNKIRCPYCAETIRKEALVCKHCGHEIKPQSSM